MGITYAQNSPILIHFLMTSEGSRWDREKERPGGDYARSLRGTVEQVTHACIRLR